MRVLLTVFLLIAAVGCADSSDPAASSEAAASSETPDLPSAAEAPNDLAALSSDAVETLLAEGTIHVHRVTLTPGDSLAAHRGGERVVYALSDLPELAFMTDGEREERSFAQGDVHRHDAGVHAVTNETDTDAAFVVFERTDVPLPDDAITDASAAPLGAGATDEVVFEDAFAEVHRVTLEPGAQLPDEWGYAGAVYSLSDYTRSKTIEDGGEETETFAAGTAHYHGADHGPHAVKNVGETVAEFLVVVFKR